MLTKNDSAGRLTGSTLKLIAIISMLIDHIGAAVIETGILHSYDLDRMNLILTTASGRNWYSVDLIFRLLGRLAFPIFCFLLVEGFLHTRDAGRYLLNLSVFALISEIPFDLAVQNRGFAIDYQNVYFTLAIGLIVLMGLNRFEKQKILQGLMVFMGCVIASILKTDYSVVGILIIVSFYLLRSNPKYQLMAAGVLSFLESLSLLGAAALALIPIHFYNGEKGRIKHKYVFYWFYPIHLLVLFLIRYFVLEVPLSVY